MISTVFMFLTLKFYIGKTLNAQKYLMKTIRENALHIKFLNYPKSVWCNFHKMYTKKRHSVLPCFWSYRRVMSVAQDLEVRFHLNFTSLLYFIVVEPDKITSLDLFETLRYDLEKIMKSWQKNVFQTHVLTAIFRRSLSQDQDGCFKWNLARLEYSIVLKPGKIILLYLF